MTDGTPAVESRAIATAPSDLLFRSPSELADLVRSGQASSRELVESALERIDALNPRLNAFTTLDAERALATADAIEPGDERPYAGVPIAVKDLFPVSGIRLTMGSDPFGDFVPQHDAHVVRRLKEAGFVIVGVTASPEVGILPVTEPRRFGPTRNPWNEEHTPGGSSGGAAAAVASGMVPVAHASDGGGSIRIPAACCGLVGLKPTRGRISMGPDLGEHFTTVHGTLTRTVADAAGMLDVLAGYEPGDATWAPPPDEPFAALAAREPARLRIAVTTTPPIAAPVDPSSAQAVFDAAELLTGLGHDVEDSTPPWTGDDLLQLFSVAFGAGVSMGVMFGAIVSGREPTEELLEPLTWELFQRSQDVHSIGYVGALVQLQALARRIVVFLSSYDALLMPSLAERPVRIGEIDGCGPDPMGTFARSGQFTPFTAIANLTGQPAISVPLFQGNDGLPLGVQIVGQPAGEGTLLALATQLEAERPWANRRPELA